MEQVFFGSILFFSLAKKGIELIFYSALKASATPGAGLPLKMVGFAIADSMELSNSSNDCGTTAPWPNGIARGKIAIRSLPSPGKSFSGLKLSQNWQLSAVIIIEALYSNPSSFA